MAIRFYYASDGIVAYVMKLIRHGTHLALKQGQEKLDLNVLSNAFEKYVKADKRCKRNPFIESDFLNELKDVSFYTSSTDMVGATNHKNRVKKRNPRASDILHK